MILIRLSSVLVFAILSFCPVAWCSTSPTVNDVNDENGTSKDVTPNILASQESDTSTEAGAMQLLQQAFESYEDLLDEIITQHGNILNEQADTLIASKLSDMHAAIVNRIFQELAFPKEELLEDDEDEEVHSVMPPCKDQIVAACDKILRTHRDLLFGNLAERFILSSQEECHQTYSVRQLMNAHVRKMVDIYKKQLHDGLETIFSDLIGDLLKLERLL